MPASAVNISYFYGFAAIVLKLHFLDHSMDYQFYSG